MRSKAEPKFYGVPGSREGAHTLRVLFWAVRPPAILADEQAKITKLILRETVPVFVP